MLQRVRGDREGRDESDVTGLSWPVGGVFGAGFAKFLATRGRAGCPGIGT